MIFSFLHILWFFSLHLEPTGGFHVRNLPRAERESWFCCERELLVQEMESNWFWCKVLWFFFFLSKEEKLNNYFLECPSQHRTKMFDQSQNRLHNCYILGLCNNCGNVWINKMNIYIYMCNIYFELINKMYLTINVLIVDFFSKQKNKKQNLNLLKLRKK